MHDRRRLGGLVGVLAVAILLAGGVVGARWYSGKRSAQALSRVPKAVVQRADVAVTVTAAGRVESLKETRVECELENLKVGIPGQEIAAGGSSTILSLIPDGTTVKKGDVLCQLDASSYEELVRQQELKVAIAESEKHQAELLLQTAQATLVEYRDGLRRQRIQELAAQIALAESNLGRATERESWARRMMGKGYVKRLNLLDEVLTKEQAATNLTQLRAQRLAYEQFQAPQLIRGYEAQIEIARSNLTYLALRLERQESQLARFRRQVEKCTVRAPQDGFAIYATKRDGRPTIQEGTIVHQKQLLFRLPDLSRMEVVTYLNETVVDRIQEGMTANVNVEAIARPGGLGGSVVAIATLPLQSSDPMATNDVKNYIGRVRLQDVPDGLRPGMSAEVEILTAKRPGALLIPAEALAVEDGREVCYVADEDGLERREVEIGRTTPGYLEVTEGLKEGEQVVLDPSKLSPDLEVTDAALPVTPNAGVPVADALH